ncbi:MAG: hypothetical protein K2X81_03795 [Candidatus Obscuribacterales bacterium]|nr:hypothetical protein [Candidatus Obscuribacterales bacterium]
MGDFEKFLLENRDSKLEKHSLLGFFPSPKILLFQPLQKEPPVWRLPAFDWRERLLLPVSESLAQANLRLPKPVPSSYSAFVSLLGPCLWAGLYITHPNYLYSLSGTRDELNGVVVIADVDGESTFLAYDPYEECTDCEEPKVRLYDNDGYAKTEDTFEDFIRSITALWLDSRRGNVVGEYCSRFEFIDYST